MKSVCSISDKELKKLESNDNIFDWVAFNEYGEHDINLVSSISNDNCIYDPEVENVICCIEWAMDQVIYSVEAECNNYL